MKFRKLNQTFFFTLLLSSSVLSLSFSAFAMEEEKREEGFEHSSKEVPESRSYRMYRGEAITPESLNRIAPKLAGKLGDKLSPEDRELLEKLLKRRGPLSKTMDEHSENCEALKEKDIENLSDYSYVFRLGSLPKYLVKISGPVHRWHNLKRRAGYSYNDKLTLEQMDKVEIVPTYQTVSAMAYTLMLREAIKEQNLDTLEAPETYLLSTIEGEVSDDYAVIVQRECLGCRSLKDHMEQDGYKLSARQIKQWLEATKAAGLWDNHGKNIMVDAGSGKLVMVDLEQPNRHSPDELFLKNPKDYQNNIVVGIEHIYKLCKDDGENQELVKAWVREQDPELFGGFYGYVKDAVGLEEAGLEED